MWTESFYTVSANAAILVGWQFAGRGLAVKEVNAETVSVIAHHYRNNPNNEHYWSRRQQTIRDLMLVGY